MLLTQPDVSKGLAHGQETRRASILYMTPRYQMYIDPSYQ